MTPTQHLAYAALWGSFGFGHSLLAGATKGRGLGAVFGRGHRLFYNMLAVLHLALVYGVGRFVLAAGDEAWPIAWPVRVAMLALAIGGLVVLFGAIASYPRSTFLGTAQWSGKGEDKDVPLHRDGLNRYVRHPLYFGALMLLWSGATSQFGFATALWGSLYLVIGSRKEEARLVQIYGSAYVTYIRRVPGLVPWHRPRE